MATTSLQSNKELLTELLLSYFVFNLLVPSTAVLHFAGREVAVSLRKVPASPENYLKPQ